MSDFVPPPPNRHHPAHWFFRFIYTFLYCLAFIIFGWPNFRISTAWSPNGTKYSEYVGLGGYKYLIYRNDQPCPPLFILQPLMKNPVEFKNGDQHYEIMQEQPH